MALVVNCLPRIVQVNGGCGCTLTRASIAGMTPAAFEALGNSEIDLARVIAESAEAKMLGVQENDFATLLKSAVVGIKDRLMTQKVDDQSIILPFIQRRQRSRINANYFLIESAAAHPTAGAGGIPASAWNIVVSTGVSEWASPLEAIERYFKPGCTVIVLTWDDTTNKNAQTLQFKVVQAVNSDSGGDVRATITLEPNYTASGWAALSTAQKAIYQPTIGVIQTGANSVSDWESWCFSSPSENPIKLIVNWLQTSRTSRCYDDVYKDTLKKVMEGKVNPYFSGFGNLTPIAEQNRQAAMLEEREWLNSVWYGQRIDENQSHNTYTNLPLVTDPEDETCVLEYKANALGYETLISECQRLLDLNGAAIDLDTIFEQLYLLKRHRGADGDSIQMIDCMTDRHTAGLIFEAMTKYVKARYGIDTTRYIQTKQRLTNDGFVGFEHNIYDIPDAGVQLAVFQNEFFDDHLAAFPGSANAGYTDIKARGRNLWFVDWSDFRVGIAGTNQVTRRSPNPEVDELYKCRMQANVKEYNLRSKRWTVMVDRPYRHLVIRNFGDACPTVTVPGCSVPNAA